MATSRRKSLAITSKINQPANRRQLKQLRVALAHDYLREYGGAERVVEALHELFPEAPLYVAFADSEAMGIHWQRFANWKIHQSWLTSIPGYKQLYSPLRIFADRYFSAFDLSQFDVVISSSNMYFAKAVRVKPSAIHISYCHTPPRALYGYSTMTDWKKNPLIRIGGELINHYLRIVDYYVSQRVGTFVANSEEVRRRIQKFYRRESVVIYPPVKVPASLPAKAAKSGEYFLYVGRLAKSKHVDLAIEACAELDLPLKVAGAGRGLGELKKRAGRQTEFLGAVTDAELADLYAGARAVIFPAEDEDFGIVPVEAMGYGTPVITHNSGGPKETVIAGKTGLLFDELSVDSLVAAIRKFQTQKFDRRHIHAHAQKFTVERFKDEIASLVLEKVGQQLNSQPTSQQRVVI